MSLFCFPLWSSNNLLCVCVCVCVFGVSVYTCKYVLGRFSLCQKLTYVYMYCCYSMAQSYPTLCNPMDCNMSGLSVLHISWNLPKFMSIALVMPSSHLILWCPLLFLASSFPASDTFPVSQLFASLDKNTGVSASASVLPMSIQGWFLLILTALIFLLSEGLSGVFTSTRVQRHKFFSTPPSLQSSSQNHVWPLGRP